MILSVKEPKSLIRMFTSRAEFRTLLRQDNADLVLPKKVFDSDLASQERIEKVLAKQNNVKEIKSVLQNLSLQPDEVNDYLQKINSSCY